MKRAKQNHQIEFIHPDTNPLRNEVAWYKWEFLRRNSHYRADHQKFVDKYGKWFEKRGYWYDYARRLGSWTKTDEDHFYNKIAPVIFQLCKKWQLGNLFPPEWEFHKESGIHIIHGRELGLPTDLPAEMNWDLLFLQLLFEWGFSTLTTSAKRIGHLVAAEFDLTWPMKDLVDYAKRMLAYAQENYHNELRQRGLRLPIGRRRLTDYETHLRVWDLREKGKKQAEIAAEIFPNYSSEEGLRRVRDHLKAAARLVRGHFKEIR